MVPRPTAGVTPLPVHPSVTESAQRGAHFATRQLWACTVGYLEGAPSTQDEVPTWEKDDVDVFVLHWTALFWKCFNNNMQMNIYIYIYTYDTTDTKTYRYKYTPIRMCIYTYIYKYKYKRIYIYTSTYTLFWFIHICTHMKTIFFTNPYTCIYSYQYIHTYIYI